MLSPKTIYMIAIGGTGMGSLAGLLKEKGYEVSGSDTVLYPPMSDQLAALQIPIKEGFKKENIGTPDFVIVGNAVSKTNEEVQEVLKRGLPMMSMPEAIETMLLPDRFSLVVAGTHGKTTTCSLLAWLLERTGQSPGFLVGGILKNFGKSHQLGSGDYFVVEGDEYDSAFFDKKAKFLHYHPQMLILNAVEFDHADIYKDLDAVMAAFSELIQKMAPSGLIVADGSNANVKKLLTQAPCRVMTFGIEEKADLQAVKVKAGETSSFHLIKRGEDLGEVTTPLAGRHNLKNLLGVMGVLLELGIPLTEINTALGEFQGVKRRQEELGTIDGVTFIDDFAHHPTAVHETLAALRSKYGKRRLWAVFEPRSNTTRRKVFEKDFATAFDEADEIIFAAPYLPEKIPPEERLEPLQVVEAIKRRGKRARYLPSVDEIVATVLQEKKSGDVVCIMSNGGFGGIHAKLLQK